MDNEPEKTKEEKLSDRMNEIIGRFACFSGWYLLNDKIGLGLDVMIRELYTQTAVNHAALQAIGDLMVKGRRHVKPFEILEISIRHLENRLYDHERQYNIRITPGECYSVDKDGNRVLEKAVAPEEGEERKEGGTIQ